MTDPTQPMPRRPRQPGDEELRHHRRTLFWRNVAIALALFALVFVLLTLTYSVLVIRDTQVTNTHRAKVTDRTLSTVLDLSQTVRGCVDPDGACYHDGQRRTAEAVGNINRVVVLAAACSVGLSPQMPVAERQAAIQACVIDRLAQ